MAATARDVFKVEAAMLERIGNTQRVIPDWEAKELLFSLDASLRAISASETQRGTARENIVKAVREHNVVFGEASGRPIGGVIAGSPGVQKILTGIGDVARKVESGLSKWVTIILVVGTLVALAMLFRR